VLLFCRYPYNLDFDYGPLEGLNKFCINNLGDPFIESNYGVHSREFEVSWWTRFPCIVPVHLCCRSTIQCTEAMNEAQLAGLWVGFGGAQGPGQLLTCWASLRLLPW